MKKIYAFLLCLSLISTIMFAQQKAQAETLVTEGIAHHDKGDFDKAISKYDQALDLDKDNLYALAEKAYSLLALKKNDDAIKCCKKAIKAHQGSEYLNSVYVTYGNALDGLKKVDKALEIYDEGIKEYPNYYHLYFNKGVTLASMEKYGDAIIYFQKSALLNPQHASSHNAVAQLSYIMHKKIPAFLAYCRFLALEPQTNRAKLNLAILQKIMKGDVEEKGEKGITINISAETLMDTSKLKENNFSPIELILSLSGALDLDQKKEKKTPIDQFISKLETVCSTLRETKKDNHGFYWDYYVPYLIEMQEKKMLKPFAYIAFVSSEDPDVFKWIQSNQDEVKSFVTWSNEFVWKKN